MRRLYFLLAWLSIFSSCRTEISLEEKDRLINGFIEFLNNLPNHQYGYEDGILLNAQETEENNYRIEVKLKEKDTLKYSKCTSTVGLQENGVSVQGNEYQCEEITPEVNPESVESTSETASEGTPTPEPPAEHKPVELDNEVRPFTEATSGEQFVAIPREEPIRRDSAACIGCGSRVEPDAPGVADLAAVGVKHLDRHEPNVRHSLNKVLDVQRQVQVVNGVRYVLTMLVDVNNCTSTEDTSCTSTEPCKISILEKPWIKLPSGGKYRAVVANNCTDAWIFGDNGEVVSGGGNDGYFDGTDSSGNPTPDYDKIANTGSGDEIVKAIHNKDLQSQQTQKELTGQELKNLQDQIIPYNQFQTPTEEAYVPVTESANNADVSKHNVDVDTAKYYSENSNTANAEVPVVSTLSDYKKKTIDELINFFDFAGFNPKDKRQTSRNKRSYENDIKLMSLVHNFDRVKQSIKDAKYIYFVAKNMVDYLNEIYSEERSRVLQEVITAEAETDSMDRHFIYLQARVIMPAIGTSYDEITKICNGVINATRKEAPKVLNAFCHDDFVKNPNFNTPQSVPHDDKVLDMLMKKALKKLESDSTKNNAMKVEKIVSASTQRGSGMLTKVSAILKFLNCNKAMRFKERKNCAVLEDFGSKICDIQIFEKDLLKDTEITYNCIDTSVDESFSNLRQIDTSVDRINDPKVIQMAQEALSYLETQSNRINRQKLVNIKSVSTQLIAGMVTTIELIIGYTKCKSNTEVNIDDCDLLVNETLRYCTVKIWHRPWLEDGKEMKVTCDDNYKTNNYDIQVPKQDLVGDYRILDPEDPRYDSELAKESLEKYLEESRTMERYEVANIDKVVVQVDEGTVTKLDFTIKSLDYLINPNIGKCHSNVWVPPTLDKKNITVDCKIYKKKSDSESQHGGVKEKDPNEPEYRALAEESMNQYLQDVGITQGHKVISVDKVTYRFVSGSLTSLDFTIKPVNFSGDSHVIKCHSKVWERRWLNKKEIKVNCEKKDIKSRKNGEVDKIIAVHREEDPNKPEYKILAEESMQKYLEEQGATNAHQVVAVDKVSVQVVVGSLTNLDFKIKPVSRGAIINCHSEVWERSWHNKKEMYVTCEQNTRNKRQVFGGEQQVEVLGGEAEKDPKDPKYQALAEESMQKYLQTSGATHLHKVISVNKVTTQVVTGTKTVLDFTIKPDGEGDIIKCHSEVWERAWLNEKDINVNCDIEQKSRQKRGVLGGEAEKDPKDPKYQALAEESMQKYLQTSGATHPHKVVSVNKVTTQVVAGTKTVLDFTIKPDGEGDIIKCHSEVWERAWLNEKDINVNCDIEQKSRQKRGVLGGEAEKDPKDPKYQALAEESMQKYLQTSGATHPHKVVSVNKVTTQVVAGTKTVLDFTIKPDGEGDIIKCHSEVWERAWLYEKDINVNCDIEQKSRQKRGVLGGEAEKDPKDPKYQALAEESMQKYLQTSGATHPHKVVSVNKVTTRVVAGTKTVLDFTIKPDGEGDIIKCHSEVWERAWLNEKDINVNCDIEQKSRQKRGVLGGEAEKDPKDPKYQALAEESMQKYLQTSGATHPHKVVSVNKVTTQVVAGTKTVLDFTIKPDGEGDIIKCHSEVWERAWLNEKDINVNCRVDEKSKQQKRSHRAPARTKRAVMYKNKHSGGLVEQDPSDPEYLTLAKDSLKKYRRVHGSQSDHVVLEVNKVTTQVVAGVMYRINFVAKRTSCAPADIKHSLCTHANENNMLFCFTKIWDRPWLKQKKVDVSCYADDIMENEHQTRDTRALNGFKLGLKEKQDVNKKEYKEMAERALKKYKNISNLKYGYSVDKIHHVTKQVTAGTTTSIDFTATPAHEKSKTMLHCQAEIWDRPGPESKQDIVSIVCKRKKAAINKQNSPQRAKRQIDAEENDIEEDMKYYYAELAVQNINDNSNTDNLHKLVSIHAIHMSTQMRNVIVRMYIEVALTYCLKRKDDAELSLCDEMDGVNHKLCHARLYPSADDELVVRHAIVICEDDPNFTAVTGFSIARLLRASIKHIESDPDVLHKMVHVGPPYVIPSLDSRMPIKINFMVVPTNCTKEVDVENYRGEVCYVDKLVPSKTCNSYIFMAPHSNNIKKLDVQCYRPPQTRTKRWISMDGKNVTADEIEIRKLAELALAKLEMESLHRYKEKILEINNYSTKLTSARETNIDFEVGYTTCIKYEWVDNLESCQLLEHLPRRQCSAKIVETLWSGNGQKIDVTCKDDETPLEAHVEFVSAQTATLLADQALRHIEAKYPNPRKQKVVRVFSLEKQVIAGLHYRLKMEVGVTNCSALSNAEYCQIVTDGGLNKFCRVNVWLRPWSEHASIFRVSCDYQNDVYKSMYEDIQAQHLFYEFVQTYKPDYMNEDTEMAKRFNIFRENVKKMHQMNVRERGTATYGVTRFADLTYEEFSSKYLGLKPGLRNENNIPMSKAKIPVLESVPPAFDWRDRDAVTEVKDQGSCGSCWAFSVTGNIEGQWKLQSGKLVSLSEQELVDCDKLDDGCNGGLPDNAYRAIEQLGGLELENDYPYEGEDDKCTFNKTMAKVQISGAVNITTNETDMAKWLVQNGPISIGINANAMQFYMGGVSHPWKMLCSPKNLDHGVLIVGYGVKDYPLFNKHLPFWTIKNSWGKSWGEQGYYRVYRGDGTCGVNQMASSAII